MRVLNFGSLNIDHVCRVPHIVRPGETIAATRCERFAGGKGLNQSIALARAGAPVAHAGRIGADGLFLKELLEGEGVDCSRVAVEENGSSGYAMIQVDDAGENSIVLYGGANRRVTPGFGEEVLADFGPGDILLMQNEISATVEILRLAARRGMRIFLNPAPMDEAVRDFPLDEIDTLIVNETEAEEIGQYFPQQQLRCNVLRTLGSRGAVYAGRDGGSISVPAAKAERVVDTTGAGDTFIGYFLAALVREASVAEALHEAAQASAIAVSRPGAAASIPRRNELS